MQVFETGHISSPVKIAVMLVKNGEWNEEVTGNVCLNILYKVSII